MKVLFLNDGITEILVDDQDYDYLSTFSWRLNTGGYAITTNRGLRMHRLIMNAPKDKFVDHLNYNRLDNRRSNLRLCTNAQNLQHSRSARRIKHPTSKYKGVSFAKERSKWLASITLFGHGINLGHYQTEHQAAMVYDLWALELFKEFANPNSNVVLFGP